MDLSTLMRCSIVRGGDGRAVTFQVDDYSWRSEALLKSDLRCGTKITAEFLGFVESTTIDGLATGLRDFARSFSGADVTVYGGSQVLAQVLAARCGNGGPHIDMTIEPSQPSALNARVKVSVNATSLDDGGGGAGVVTQPTSISVKTKTAVAPSGLRIITQSGEVIATNSDVQFHASVLDPFRAVFSLPSWSVGYDYEITRNLDNLFQASKLAFTLSAREMQDGLPGSGRNAAVDGTHTIKVDRDDQFRKITTEDYDLLLDSRADPQKIVDLLMPKATPMKLSVSISRLKELRVRVTITTMGGGDGSDLMNWSQSLEWTGADQVWIEKRYEGADPIAIAAPKSMPRISQTGTASGAARWIKPPDPVYPHHAAAPRIRFEQASNWEFRTTWTYDLLAIDETPDGATLVALLGRPDGKSVYLLGGA